MEYPYVYLSLMPSLIVIAFLIFNKSACEKYNTKKAFINLLSGGISLACIFTWRIISNHYAFSKIGMSKQPLWFFIVIFIAGIIAPMLALNRSKLNRKEDILDKKWFLFVIIAVLVIFMIFMPGILMTLKFKS